MLADLASCCTAILPNREFDRLWTGQVDRTAKLLCVVEVEVRDKNLAAMIIIAIHAVRILMGRYVDTTPNFI